MRAEPLLIHGTRPGTERHYGMKMHTVRTAAGLADVLKVYDLYPSFRGYALPPVGRSPPHDHGWQRIILENKRVCNKYLMLIRL
jgi:hypothetical protein